MQWLRISKFCFLIVKLPILDMLFPNPRSLRSHKVEFKSGVCP